MSAIVRLKFILTSVTFILCITCISAQTISKEWIKKPFANKAFIENNGQYTIPDSVHKGPVLCAVRDGEMEAFFFNDGMVFKFNEFVGPKQIKNEEKPVFKSHFISVNWIGANSKPDLLKENKIEPYFTFACLGPSSEPIAIIAHAFEQITYTNIYPQIDLIYSFPKAGPGIKYAFQLHPGADPSLIRLKYGGINASKMDSIGNIILQGPPEEIVDYEPIYFNDMGSPIAIKAYIDNNELSFHIGPHKKEEDITLDPRVMISNPITDTLCAYDVDSDKEGNVYVYGGAFPYQLLKYNSFGILQWTFTNSSLPGGRWYGDFAVEPGSGSCFLVFPDPPGNPAFIMKVNSDGQLVTTNSAGNLMNEFWRVVYNPCLNELAIGGGGTENIFQGATVDTNLIHLNSVNILGTDSICHDIPLLATNNNGDVFFGSCDPGGVFTDDNMLVKASISGLSPVSYKVPDFNHFKEEYGPDYYFSQTGASLGYNGMAAVNAFVFIYNGTTLFKYNSSNGSFIDSVLVGANGSRGYGGIAATECGSLYLGFKNELKKFDFKLNLISSTTAAGIITDIKIQDGHQIYLCGLNFVQSMLISDALCPACYDYNSECGIYVPNYFSPNNDGKNDQLCLYSNCFQAVDFSIYDRWGEKVFGTSDPKECWDGNYKGKPMSTAVFAYQLKATLITGRVISQKGAISLAR
jgi:gliding motility-associated-like protein